MPQSPRDRFQDYLAAQGMRFTRERVAIFDDASRRVVPFTYDEVAELLKERPDGIRASPSTVYRTLMELEKAGLIRRSDSPGKIEFCGPDEYT